MSERRPLIGLDARLAAGDYTGIGIYTRGLVRALAALDPPERFVLFTDRDLEAPSPAFRVVRLPLRRRAVWTQALLPLGAMGVGLDLFHATANYELPLAWRVPSVVTVHDLIPLLFPQTVTARHRLVFRALIGPAVRRARAVITDSEYVRRELMERYGLAPGTVHAVPLAPDPSFAPAPAEEIARVRARYRLRATYALYVGAMEPRKNLPALIRAFSRCAGPGWQLVIAGGGGWLREETMHAAADSGLGDRLAMTGFVPQEDLPALYSGASFFVYPSLYEGFGLPVLEAMAAGTPVLVSSPSALEEVAGEPGMTFRLDQPGDLEEKLAALMADETLRSRLAEEGRRRAAGYSWELTASRTLGVYRSVLGVTDTP